MSGRHSDRALLTFRRPSEQRIAEFLESQRTLPFTYARIGITRLNDKSAESVGFNRDHLRVHIGHGDGDFARAVAALRAWKMFDQGWIKLHAAGRPPEVDQVVAIEVHIGPLSWLNAARVEYMIDESGPQRRIGFAYGTLPGHAEQGEERFAVECDAQGAVWYDVLAYSRPRHWLVKLGYPFTRLMQQRFANGSAAAMASAMKQPDTP